MRLIPRALFGLTAFLTGVLVGILAEQPSAIYCRCCDGD